MLARTLARTGQHFLAFRWPGEEKCYMLRGRRRCHIPDQHTTGSCTYPEGVHVRLDAST